MKKHLITLIVLILISILQAKNIGKKNSIDIQIKLGGLYLQNGHPANESYLKTYGNEVTKIIEGDIEYTFKPKDKMAARLELEADNNRAGVIRIKEAWFQLPVKSHTIVRFGNSKKDLGFKGNMGSFKRKFYDKSLIYRYLRSFKILDYDIMLRVKLKHKFKNVEPQYIIATGADEDQKVYLNLSYSINFNHSTIEISDLFINHIDTRYNKQNNNHLILGYKHIIPKWYKAIELFTGINPDASNQLAYLKRERTVHYFGSELEIARFFKFPKKETRITKGIEPVINCSWLSQDLKYADDGFLELRAGINVILSKTLKARWHSSYGYVMQRNGNLVEKWSEKNSSILSVVQICW